MRVSEGNMRSTMQRHHPFVAYNRDIRKNMLVKSISIETQKGRCIEVLCGDCGGGEGIDGLCLILSCSFCSS